MLKKTTAALLFSIVINLFSFAPAAANEADREVRVMTYNMYLGAEFGDIFASQSGAELVTEVAEAYSDLAAGKPVERIDEIADQIATHSPDIVGLQEVALWRVGAPFDPAPAENVTFDFLQILLDKLAARGKSYAAIAVQSNLDAELPGVFGPTAALDVRFTDRVVIIARTDLQVSDFKIEGTSAGAFETLLPVNLLGTPLVITRGWTSADIKHRGKTYRFVNAHLESFYDPVQWAQAGELLQGPTATTLPTILVGDLNSDAATNPAGYSYQIIGSGGFADAWSLSNAGSPGLTWPLSAESPATFLTPTQRLDLVMVRGNVTVSGAEVIGEDAVNDLTYSGARPSDHAGVFASIILHP